MIIFDFDGVLADSLQVCLTACNNAARNQGADLTFATDAFATLNPVTFEALAEHHGLDPSPFARDVAAAVSASPVRSAIFDGIDTALFELARLNRLAVVSASDASVIRAVLAPSGLDRLMDPVIGGDTPGTKAEKISKLVAESLSAPHVMVGDAASDILAARAAGIAAISVTWGWQTPAHLAAHNPDAIVETPQDLVRTCRSVLAG